MNTGSLESVSLWFRYKSEVWLEESEQSATVHNIMRTARSFRLTELAYVSVPITSGQYLYTEMKQHPLAREHVLIERAIQHNYWAGSHFVDDIGVRRDCPILFPADLTPVHQKWEQSHFQSLWLSIIAEMCTELHMSEGWEFSNGGCEELTHAFQLRLGVPKHENLLFFNTKESEEDSRERMKKIKIYDHKGVVLELEHCLASMERSLAWIGENGFSAPKIERCHEALVTTQTMLAQGFYQ